MATQQDDQHDADQPDLVLNLSHFKRDQLIASFIQLNTILQCNKPMSHNFKQMLSKKMNESIRLLLELTPVMPSQSNSDTGLLDKILSGYLVIGLSRAERSIVVNHLIAIKDAMLFEGLNPGETKLCLAIQNRQIIDQLLDLPCREQIGAFCDPKSVKDVNENGEPPTKKQKVGSPSNEELVMLKVLTKSHGEKITSLESRIEELKKELKREIKEVDINRAEASFKFELVGVSKFIEIEANERHSARFWAQGLQWSLLVRCNLKKKDKYLGLSLLCHNDEPPNWSCKTSFNLILFTNLPGAENWVRQFIHNFDKNEDWGLNFFISCTELMDEKNQYVKDDKIMLGVELKAEPVVRD